ncbi:branched-chain amino acid transport system permease protein [Streptomyces sp. cf386]|uniref:branched-chain amino acid ABC transporter ATP-binding protein/permease n=1 Tax=Streptomyces sp. cf386 TaxID=1761904 RepID=UPI00088DB305|nr:branched-chain amino acid ABC transporter ATP-binding protein/permease [Streptomyces sp. cf386]SDN22498.1 branched-chain amino acid transport system permease protein [Streptomyces sp. cf386]
MNPFVRKLLPVPLAAAAAVLAGPWAGGLLAQCLVLGTVTAALALTWGTAGILNLGHSVTFGVGAYAGAWFGLHAGAYGSLAGLAAGALLGGVVARLIAAVGLRRGLDAVGFALATFVVALAAEQVAGRWTGVTGGFNGLTDVPRFHIGALAFTPTAARGVTAGLAVLVIVLLASLARRPYGVALAAVRDNERRMAALGYDVGAAKTGVFTFTGVVAGLMGAVYVLQVQFVSPSLIGLVMGTNFVVWAMLGSRRTIWGPVVATLVVSAGANLLADAALDYWLLATGAAFVAAVVFVPDGVAVVVRRRMPARWFGARQVVLGTAAPSAGGRADGGLVVRSVGCRFGPFTALRGVDLDLTEPGVHCLIGPNGAGKSTLLDVLSGFTPATDGSWRLNGRDVTGRPPWELTRSGLGRKFQAPSVAGSLTLAENLALARWGRTHAALALVRQPWTADLPPEAWFVLDAAGFAGRMDTPAGSLSHGEQQLLELAMTLTAGCDVLLLDEPTAGMTRSETEQVAEVLRGLVRDHALPVLVVEHDMAFIRSVADRVTVLRDGEVMASGTVAEIESNSEVSAVYVGRAAGGRS